MSPYSSFSKLVIQKCFRLDDKSLLISTKLLSMMKYNGAGVLSYQAKRRYVSVDILEEELYNRLFQKNEVDKIKALLSEKKFGSEAETNVLRAYISDIVKNAMQMSLQYLHYYQCDEGLNATEAIDLACAHSVIWTILAKYLDESILPECLDSVISQRDCVREIVAGFLKNRSTFSVYSDGIEMARALLRKNLQRIKKPAPATLTLLTFYHYCSIPRSTRKKTVYYELLINVFLQSPDIGTDKLTVISEDDIDMHLYEHLDIDDYRINDTELDAIAAEASKQLGIAVYRPHEAVCVTIVNLNFTKDDKLFTEEKLLLAFDSLTGYIYSAKFITGEIDDFTHLLRYIVEQCHSSPRFLLYSPVLAGYVENHSNVLQILKIQASPSNVEHKKFSHFLNFYNNTRRDSIFQIEPSLTELTYAVTFNRFEDEQAGLQTFPSDLIRQFNDFKSRTSASARECFHALHKYDSQLQKQTFASIFFKRYLCKNLKTVCLVVDEEFTYVYDLGQVLDDVKYILIGNSLEDEGFAYGDGMYVTASYRTKFMEKDLSWIQTVDDVPDPLDARRERTSLWRAEYSVVADPSEDFFNSGKSRRLRKQMRAKRLAK